MQILVCVHKLSRESLSGDSKFTMWWLESIRYGLPVNVRKPEKKDGDDPFMSKIGKNKTCANEHKLITNMLFSKNLTMNRLQKLVLSAPMLVTLLVLSSEKLIKEKNNLQSLYWFCFWMSLNPVNPYPMILYLEEDMGQRWFMFILSSKYVNCSKRHNCP